MEGTTQDGCQFKYRHYCESLSYHHQLFCYAAFAQWSQISQNSLISLKTEARSSKEKYCSNQMGALVFKQFKKDPNETF